jgi:hypothetical protein
MNATGKPEDSAVVNLSEEDRSKDELFVQLAHVAEAMIEKHGKDFAMGGLVLAARFIAEGRPLVKRQGTMSDWIKAAN